MMLSSVQTAAFAASRMLQFSNESAAIDNTLFNQFIWMSEYAAIGYCNSDGTVGDVVSCKEDACADVVSNGATIVATLDCGFESTGGVIIKDDVNKAIVVSFAGTNTASILDLTLDLDFIQESTGLCDDCKVHDGFHGAWTSVKETVYSTIQDLVAETNNSYSVSFTGHSLGAAVSTLGCAFWRNNGGSCDVYTFGSPRVGNLAFAEFVSSQAGNEYRMTHLDDPIPRLPGHYLGYYHTDMEYWLSDGEDVTVDYTPSDVVICTGTYNTSCNGAGTISLDTKAHSFYLGRISACG